MGAGGGRRRNRDAIHGGKDGEGDGSVIIIVRGMTDDRAVAMANGRKKRRGGPRGSMLEGSELGLLQDRQEGEKGHV